MTGDHTAERIELLTLLQRLKLDGENPGQTVLRALRVLDQQTEGERRKEVRPLFDYLLWAGIGR